VLSEAQINAILQREQNLLTVGTVAALDKLLRLKALAEETIQDPALWLDSENGRELWLETLLREFLKEVLE
jgi:hypothetical protein